MATPHAEGQATRYRNAWKRARCSDGQMGVTGITPEERYLDHYSIVESIEDETTLRIKHTMARSTMMVPTETLEDEFFALAADEEITDVEELNRVLDSALGLRTFLGADDRIENATAFVAEHFRETVDPLGHKACLVAVDREACAKYKQALDRQLPPERSGRSRRPTSTPVSPNSRDDISNASSS